LALPPLADFAFLMDVAVAALAEELAAEGAGKLANAFVHEHVVQHVAELGALELTLVALVHRICPVRRRVHRSDHAETLRISFHFPFCYLAIFSSGLIALSWLLHAYLAKKTRFLARRISVISFLD